jgi:tRNA-dihydrouridine synthase
MIGRGAYGAPWLPGRIAEYLASGRDPGEPDLAAQRDIALEHIEAMLVHYGSELGLRNARKHVGWYLVSSGASEATVKSWRAKLCTALEPRRVLAGLAAFYSGGEPLAA